METERTAEKVLTDDVRLILDNDQGLYNQRREIVRSFLRPEPHYPHILGDMLKEWCERIVGLEDEEPFDTDAGLARELLSTALAFVDWRGLAEDYIAEEQEVSA